MSEEAPEWLLWAQEMVEEGLGIDTLLAGGTANPRGLWELFCWEFVIEHREGAGAVVVYNDRTPWPADREYLVEPTRQHTAILGWLQKRIGEK
tara:strand:+ start:512 stop:790 length:279 start_codon:yes stop_codon:yes gene_type:complete